jgi:hypothetical protein
MVGRPTSLPLPRDLEHVDWRGRGGYVVAPPSRHHSGGTYEFVHDLTHVIPEVPAALRARLESERATPGRPALPEQPPRLGHPYGLQALTRECAALSDLTTDSRQRNRTLYLAGLRLHSLAAGGVLDQADVTVHLLAAAQRCGLSEKAAATIESPRKVASQHPRSVPDRQRPRSPRPRRRRPPGAERPSPSEAERES